MRITQNWSRAFSRLAKETEVRFRTSASRDDAGATVAVTFIHVADEAREDRNPESGAALRKRLTMTEDEARALRDSLTERLDWIESRRREKG